MTMSLLARRTTGSYRFVWTVVIATVLSLGVATSASTALADDATACTTGTIEGSYGIQTTGFSDFVPGPNPSRIGDFVPITSVGRSEFLSDGTFTSSELANIGGLVFPFTGAGTFEVNPDCTGTLTRNISIGGPAEALQFVVVQDGDKILLMGEFPGGRLFSGHMERVSDGKQRREQ